jgi:hypothetical protein
MTPPLPLAPSLMWLMATLFTTISPFLSHITSMIKDPRQRLKQDPTSIYDVEVSDKLG